MTRGLALAACALFFARADAQNAAKTGHRHIPPSVNQPLFLSDIRAEVQPIYEMGQLPGPLGITRLDSTRLPAGVREIRIYTGSIAGYPASGVIVSEDPSRIPRVKGRMFRYWPVNDPQFTEDVDLEATYAEGESGRCARPVRGKDAVTCDVQFDREPDWELLLKRLDSLDAWNLPDERKVPRRNVMMIHGWRIRAEARRDTVYKLWWYDNPQLFRPPEGANAHRIMRLVYDLYAFSKPASNIRYSRGIYLFGPDTSDFTPCSEANLNGYLEGMLTPVTKLIGDSAWKARAAPTRSFVVEGWFHLRTANEVKRGTRSFRRVWYADTLTSAKVSSRHCP